MTEVFTELKNTTEVYVENTTFTDNSVQFHIKGMVFVIPKIDGLNIEEIKSLNLSDDGAITSTHAIFMYQLGSNSEPVITKLSNIDLISIDEDEKTFKQYNEDELYVPSKNVFIMV
jgi:hypothetical protein